MNKKSHFTVWLKIDYYDSPDEDKIIAMGKAEPTLPGSFWQYSVGDVLDCDNKTLNKQSALQIDVPVRHGGLKWLLKDLLGRLPRFLDENGLKSI